MTASAHVLVVDDEPAITEVLRRYLSTQGYRVSLAESGAAMRRIMAGASVDLVLLDLGLPGEDGLTLMRALREHSPVAIIVVTGRGEPVDRIVGLEVGADDYITKPFDLRELGARVRSVLRRTLEKKATSPQGSPVDVVRFAGWMLDLGSRRLESPCGEPVDLTTGEFELLAAFVKAPGRVVSRDELLEATRNREAGPFDRTIDVQVGRLRRKIEADPQRPEIIKSVRAAGYLFTPRVERS
ncbi:MAG TPA: response regulator [Casimicrobiaceae bacterium]|nr:response regulator [Casimicrobiaceae bacterium]